MQPDNPQKCDVILSDDDTIEVTIEDGRIWINVNGICLFRAKLAPATGKLLNVMVYDPVIHDMTKKAH